MKKRILGFVLSLALVATAAINPMVSYAASEAGAPTEHAIAEFRQTKSTSEDVDGTTYEYYTKAPTAPEGYEGYVFGGWYTTSDCTTAVGEDVTEGTAWAKWVPKSVLSVKYQMTTGTTVDSWSTDFRFVTTVDSLSYKCVGFKFTQGGQMSKPVMTNTVYETIYAAGSQVTAKAAFGDPSAYFMAKEINNMSHSLFATDFTVYPVWITLDGTMVEGVNSTANIAKKAIVSNLDDKITFDNATEANLFRSCTIASEQVALQTVQYANTGITADEATYGASGLMATCPDDEWGYRGYPSIIVNLGKTYAAGTTFTFNYYIETTEALATEIAESGTGYQRSGATTTGVGTKDAVDKNVVNWGSTPGNISRCYNQWVSGKATLLQATDTLKIQFGLYNATYRANYKLGDTIPAIYLDNLYMDVATVADIVGFENVTEPDLVTADSGITSIERVHYADEGLEAEECGDYGLKLNAQSGSNKAYPTFNLAYGAEAAAGSTLTFDAYVKVDGADVTDYARVESTIIVDNGDGTTSKSYCTRSADPGFKVNAWHTVTLKLNAAEDVQNIFFNFDDTTQSGTQSIFGDKAVTIYLDNITLTPAS